MRRKTTLITCLPNSKKRIRRKWLSSRLNLRELLVVSLRTTRLVLLGCVVREQAVDEAPRPPQLTRLAVVAAVARRSRVAVVELLEAQGSLLCSVRRRTQLLVQHLSLVPEWLLSAVLLRTPPTHLSMKTLSLRPGVRVPLKGRRALLSRKL